MANESEASETAVSLIAAACVVAPPLPREPAHRQAWLASVATTAASLYRQAQSLDVEIARLAQCRSVPGDIVRVEESKGRGLITYRSDIGNPRHKAPDGTETVRTPWLNDPRGAALFAHAQSLVGQRCLIGKYVETKADGTGESVAMVAWIDSLALSDAPVKDEPAEAPPSHSASRGRSPQPPTAAAASPGPAPEPTPAEVAAGGSTGGAPELDLAQLRNLPMRNLDDLMMNAFQHFGVDGDTVHLIGMEACGAAGPRSSAQYLKTWNQLVTRYYREAA